MTTTYFRIGNNHSALANRIGARWDSTLQCWYALTEETCRALRYAGFCVVARTGTPLHLRRHRAERQRLQ